MKTANRFSLLIAAMMLIMTGLSGLDTCNCLHPLEEWEMPSVATSDSHPSCCSDCGPDHDCCSTPGKHNQETRDEGLIPESRTGAKQSIVLQASQDFSMLIETLKDPPCSKLSFEFGCLLPHLSTTVLLI